MNFQFGHRWSYNLTDAADYFAGYRSLMRHWASVFDGSAPSLELPLMEIRSVKTDRKYPSSQPSRASTLFLTTSKKYQ